MKIRALVVDDSVVFRRLLTELLQSDPDIEVVGTAATASIGIQKIPQVSPDVVLMDVEMPEMDGIEAASRVRAGWPGLPIIMCSGLTERGAEITMRALQAGASDYMTKPSTMSQGSDRETFRREVLAKVHALTGRRTIAPPALRVVEKPVAPPRIELSHARSGKVELVAIGSSTGGPNALAAVFGALPPDMPVPILLTQHMPPLFTRILAERLTAGSKVTVVEAKNGDIVLPGHAYVAPGDFHMRLARDGAKLIVTLDQGPQENSCRPAVDVMFRSVARTIGAGALGVVLTGMGHDGARGSAAIVEAGGSVFVQDAASCVVPSMPRSVAELGIAYAELPIDSVGPEIARRVNRQGFGGPAVKKVEGWK